MESEIQQRLTAIARDEGVHIIYACESGSRAWGFASKDSDYDVRFIYVHPRDWYLSIFEERDVIERPIVDEIDINGWDLRKALRLMWKSNPPLIEWLNSPIVYRAEVHDANLLKQCAQRCYSPRSCLYHYHHMASGNYREFLQRDRVKLKKYLYVLRPLLACRWIATHEDVVPVRFETLLDEVLPAGNTRETIDALVARKAAGEELSEGPKVPVLNAFIEEELARFASERPPVRAGDDLRAQLDASFRAIVLAR